MQLEDWLDDLCVRFIINLPPEELASVERICFQVEEAQWFYEDFIRPLDPSLPSLSLKAFSLRIFQHCPLFSTWSMQHYTSAFAEFLAYKQRVPVRGAILLNEELDEVVLVKGWKKGANWSFPRGKINKDENDLDCAVREVYEETGYDIQAAGLVKPEKDMKYIEVTMREQHMRLYVFRGVPKSTHFEPKTRKEISKIEWYKLTDLPTLKKKHAHHESHEDNHALNANKFYMVAPFLHPLKKWIAQQRKVENRYSSSQLAAPPILADESATEGEPGPVTYSSLPHQVISPQVPSSLPELAINQYQQPPQDPSVHLKELLKIGVPPRTSNQTAESENTANIDVTKSNALLSLLRNGPGTDGHQNQSTPSGQRQHPHPEPGAFSQVISPEAFTPNIPQSRSSNPGAQGKLKIQQQSLLDLFSKTTTSSARSENTTPASKPPDMETARKVPENLLAPYQRTGDPEFTRQRPDESRASIVPPANALPKLTQHTRALLDAFRIDPSPQTRPLQSAEHTPQPALEPQLAPKRRALLDIFKTGSPAPREETSVAESPSTITSLTAMSRVPPQTSHTGTSSDIQQPPMSNASSLLRLFKKPAFSLETGPKQEPDPQSSVPAELAAAPMMSSKSQGDNHQAELLGALLRRDAPKRQPQATKAGETAATVDGPLNQPNFETITKSSSQFSADSMRRSPVPAHRTLFNPKQPTPTKILQRSDDSKHLPGKSPRPAKTNTATSSPKQRTKPKPEKPFQPQILRRPQSSEIVDNTTPKPVSYVNPNDFTRRSSPLPSLSTQIPGTDPSSSAPHQPVSHTESLLSLLTSQAAGDKPTQVRQMSMSGLVSPLSHSQGVSPLGDEPISTRSRMSSLASATSGVAPPDNRPKPEKRQTTASDKAFLLGYLGRIANQEGQAQ